MIQESRMRSAFKAVSYRLIILILDFSVIYFITKKVTVALAFMVISNLYATIAYFIHERVWNKVRWGIKAEIKATP